MTTVHRMIVLLIAAIPFTVLHADPAPELTLATQLATEGNHAGAALEYRRLAMDTADPKTKAVLLWMASYDYFEAERYPQTEHMLSQVENLTSELESEVYLMRSAQNRAQDRLREAAFYLEALTEPERAESVRTVAARKLAAVRLRMRDFEGARTALHALPQDDIPQEFNAIHAYETGKDKNHVVGGLLGLIPGLGYAYSGEYANALRSLILNGICGWALVEFIDEEQWGGVAIAGFAEVTFYSGSIYGGADAAIRYNEKRLHRCMTIIEGDADITPDRTTLPVLTLQYTF